MKNLLMLLLLSLTLLSQLEAKIDSITIKGCLPGVHVILLNNKAKLQFAKMNHLPGSLAYHSIIRGMTKKATVDQTKVDSIFVLANKLIGNKIIDKYIENGKYSHYYHAFPTTIKLYEDGKELIQLTYYDYERPDPQIESFCDQIKSLTASKKLNNWNTKDLNLSLIPLEQIDSISITEIVKPIKTEHKTIRKHRTISQSDLEYLLQNLNTLKKVNPLKNNQFENINELKKHFYIQAHRGTRKTVIPFDGRHFRKEFYLWFKADKKMRKIICD